MKVTAYGMLTFFVCFNLGFFLLNETDIIPYEEQSPHETPEGMRLQLLSFNTTVNQLFIAGTTLAAGGIVSYILTGSVVSAGIIVIILFALAQLLPIVSWVVYGFPTFLQSIPWVPDIVYQLATVFTALVWAWFILGFLGQRSGWES